MPIDEPLSLARSDEYVERFDEVLGAAITDRLRTDKVSVFMSGGLDSSSLAALAAQRLGRHRGAAGVQAYTTLIDGLDGGERYYANLVAAHLQIPIHTWDLRCDENWDQTAIRTPEPVGDPTQLAPDRAQYASTAAHARVAFYGEGPDNALMFEWRAYLAYLVNTRQPLRLIKDVYRHAVLHRRVPLLPSARRIWRARRQRDNWIEPFPRWLDADFASRLQLQERWQRYWDGSREPSSHPFRPGSYAALSGPFWEPMFRSFDADTTGAALEVRHPYLDLRVLRFCLALPAVPWCRRKLILRRAMRARLPQPVLERDKTALSSDPLWEHARRFGLSPMRPDPRLAAYVNAERVSAVADHNLAAFRMNFRPRALNYWLSNGAHRP
jgi:asparagine synthase (glutamine-hydrolysing)